MSDTTLPAAADRPAARPAPPRRAPPPEADWRSALAMHARVVGAVVMRDLQTRFGSSYFGFLLALIFPLGHLLIVTAIYTVLGRTTPIGTDIIPFVISGVLPFIIWLYAHRQTMVCLSQNRPLLYFPGIATIDIVIGRSIIEVAAASIVSFSVISILPLTGRSVTIGSPEQFVNCLIFSLLLGIGTGSNFSVLGSLWSPALIAGNLLVPLTWATSGLLFIPDQLPSRIRSILQFLPLPQLIDAARLSYFTYYTSDFFSGCIIFFYLVFFLLSGLILHTLSRKWL